MISNYTELQAAVANWLGRSDLTARIPEFIQLGERELDRRVTRRTVVGTLNVSAESTTLPADCGELRTILPRTGLAYNDRPFLLATPVQAAEYRARHGDVAGRPITYFVADGKIWVTPRPDTTYETQITYYEKITPLSVSVSTNSLLTSDPDLYLYAALAQAEPYLENDARAALWVAALDRGIEQLNIKRDREQYGESLAPARVPRKF